MSNFIDQEQYVDAPMIYGQHAPYWSSLDFFDKLRTIRHVGLFSFFHEVLGYSDTKRIQARLEVSHAALAQECEDLRKQINELKKSARQKNEKVSKQASNDGYNGIDPKILTPPQAREIVAAFNCNCYEGAKPYFFNPYEKPGSGDIVLQHNFRFYPFAELIVPRGKLRLRDHNGYVANLAQNEKFAALPSRYAKHLVPPSFRPVSMRVLFVTRYEFGLYLDEPRNAQDLVLEIRTLYTQDTTHYKDSLASYNSAIQSWENQRKGKALGTLRETTFDLIVSVEDLLSDGENNFSKEQTEQIRKKCYAEYLDIYFKDGHCKT